MPELNLYTSNRLEILADRLARILEDPLQSPMTPEIIVVQSNGMKRWISLRLAEHFSVWANCRYMFPNAIVSEIFQSIIPEAPGARFFDINVMTWQIMDILPSCIDEANFESLRFYLEDDKGFLKCYQLSAQIADVFDQYLTFRPDMILKWDSGKEMGWQSHLWRLLSKRLTSDHPPRLREIFFKKIADESFIESLDLPQRISVFGISIIPKFHMDILTTLSAYIEINLFLMNPSERYWADIRSEHDIAKSLRDETPRQSTSEELHLEKGNSLLASMGKAGRDFLWTIMEFYDPQDYSVFEDPGSTGLLHLIQSDILNMIDRGVPHDEQGVHKSIDDLTADNSISIHSCHSPMREVEVLYDFLLELFNNNDELEPRDILVMTPDIETYSPFIQTVFGAPGALHIPFSITDISIRKENRAADTFLAVLDLASSRFEASRVLDILESDHIQDRFGLFSGDFELIRKWVSGTRICWGIEASDRERIGLPKFDENTWNAGINRLLLGYAMPGNNEITFHDILPYDNIEGNESLILGKFINFFNTLSNHIGNLKNRHTLKEWYDILLSILDNLFSSDEHNEDMQSLRNSINRFFSIEEESGFDGQIELAVVKSWFENVLSDEVSGSGFLTGHVTFCTMLPMRSIPFKVVSLLGMNDNAFPRTYRTPSFNLIAKHPKRGDRFQRYDDRYLFLESIISARESLYISYVGQSIQDNSGIPPSVVVSELIDYIEQAFIIPGEKISDHIISKHRLQAFSTRYFENDKRLFSYSSENFTACRNILQPRRKPAPFISGKLCEQDEKMEVIELNDLIKFFNNPAKHLLNQKLGIFLDDDVSIIEDREPFDVLGLNKYLIEQEIIERHLLDNDIEPLYNIMRSSGQLPHGRTGELSFKSLIPGVRDFGRNVKPYIIGDRLEPCSIDLDIAGFRLVGKIDNIWQSGFVYYRYAEAKAKDRLKAWLLHLALNAAQESSYPTKSYLICKDASWEMANLENSRDILKVFIEIYHKGRNELLKFFPETSYDYARYLREKNSHEFALKKANFNWEGNERGYMERNDPYFNLSFRAIEPLDKEFIELSLLVYGSLLTYQEKIQR